MPGKVQSGSGRSPKVKTIDLTKEIKIIRTRSDFDKFINHQKEGASSDTLDDLTSLIDFVVHSKQSNVNRTKPLKDVIKKKIEVPPTVMHKDENFVTYPFTITPRYIRFIQTRVSVPGLKLTDNTIIHYNLYKEDKTFIDSFNSRSSDLHISVNEFLVIMDIFEKASAQCHSNKPFSYELGLLVARENGISVPAYILREVHAHWVKRRNEFGLPLIRHLWPQTCPNDTSPLALFRPRAKDKMLLRRSRRTQAENIQYLYHLIDGFKRVLKILTKMRQRDEKKLILAELDIVLFDQKRNELVDPTYTCPFWNCILDIKKSKVIKKRKTNSICSDESFSNRDIKLDFVERNVLKENALELPEAESYKRMRLSRRLGRGGRLWIDRFYLNKRANFEVVDASLGHALTADNHTSRKACIELEDGPEATSNLNGGRYAGMREKGQSSEREWKENDSLFQDVKINRNLDHALSISKYDNFEIYQNKRPLDHRPPFANPYEAGHVYNTIGLSMFSIPGYIKRQLQVLDLLDNINVHDSTNPKTTCRQFNMLGEYLNWYEKIVKEKELKEDESERMVENGEVEKVREAENMEGTEMDQNVEEEEEEADFGSDFSNCKLQEIEELVEEMDNFLGGIHPEDPICQKMAEKRMVNYYDNVVLASKLKIAEDKINQLREDAKKSSEDFFKMEQMMKETYYRDLETLKNQTDLKIREKQKKLDYLVEKSRENDRLWEDRKNLLNTILNDYISNVNECLKIKDLYDVFAQGSPEKSPSRFVEV